MEFGAAGSRVVTAGAVDGSIRIWDVRTGRTVSLLPRHTTTVNTVEVSPDGSLILSASEDRTATLFPCQTCGAVQVVRDQAKALLARVAAPGAPSSSGYTLAEGDCYNPVGRYARTVDCTSPHESEVFAVIEHDAGYEVPFDEQLVDGFVRRECEGRVFEGYVGAPAVASRYRVSAWKPNRGSWEAGDRRIACTLTTDERRTGTARGSRR